MRLQYRRAEPAASDLVVQVDLDSSYGVGASFQCARAEVILAVPTGERRGPQKPVTVPPVPA